MGLCIVFLVLGLGLVGFFLYEKCKKYSLKAVLIKACASIFFLTLAFYGAYMSGFTILGSCFFAGLFFLYYCVIIKVQNVKNRIDDHSEVDMKISENEDKEIVRMIREGLEQTGGYCPCRRERTPDTKCMCKEFRDQIKDPSYEGYCHCLLYYKSL